VRGDAEQVEVIPVVHREDEPPRELIIPAIASAVTQEEAEALAGLARGKTVLELGAHYGFSTIVLASVAERVFSVDWHGGDVHAGLGDSWAVFCSNLQRYGVEDRVTVLRGRFEDEVPLLAEEGVRVDTAFIDGQHDLASVERDLALALTLVRPSGVVAFHDYGRGPHTGHHDFAITEVADKFGVAGQVGYLAWGFVPDRDGDDELAGGDRS
jgi:predicted O-methyltransferase YrrM